MKRVVAKARLIAPRPVPVLIEGDSGTGKELLARAIHKASPRRENPFVAVNCGAIASELIESELFGHEKGAFTGAEKQRIGYFEAANTEILFLDEIGELPLAAQVKLLRALQNTMHGRIPPAHHPQDGGDSDTLSYYYFIQYFLPFTPIRLTACQ